VVWDLDIFFDIALVWGKKWSELAWKWGNFDHPEIVAILDFSCFVYRACDGEQ